MSQVQKEEFLAEEVGWCSSMVELRFCKPVAGGSSPSTSSTNMINVTEHAEKRAKERCGWSRSAIHRMAEKAFESGVTHSETRGKLHRYLSKIYMKEKNTNNLRVYGSNIFLFAGHTLITVYNIPKDMLSGAR